MRRSTAIATILCVFQLWIGPATLANVKPLSQTPDTWRVGSGRLTWLGMTVYEATLYAPQGEYREDLPHAIRIDYRFSFDRRQLAESSLQEIERIFGTRQDGEQIVARLESLFCNVTRGDRILGIHYPGQGAEFHCNGKPQGQIEDAELAAAFFAIWLNPHTSEPELREQLLGFQP